MSLWVETTAPVELRPNFTEDDLQTVIRAVYKQVLGNAHLLEGDRLDEAESMKDTKLMLPITVAKAVN